MNPDDLHQRISEFSKQVQLDVIHSAQTLEQGEAKAEQLRPKTAGNPIRLKSLRCKQERFATSSDQTQEFFVWKCWNWKPCRKHRWTGTNPF